MTDDEIRQLIRSAIARHLGPAATHDPLAAAPALPAARATISFARYQLPRAPDDVQCLIEPAVACTHCGYCQCHGL
ncbi:MAG: hypothetical protein OEW19_02115 [Acidobacteriota bacterium]|nr:hypothetical protein [Acidobacteriota bacterium]